MLELVEESLDMSLSGNMVRYKFQDTPVLPKVTVQEAQGNVVILVATVASVHRLVFPHPSKLNRPVHFLHICIEIAIYFYINHCCFLLGKITNFNSF